MKYKFKGTPGPWCYVGGDNASIEVNIEETTANVDRSDKNTFEYVIEREEMEANGKLISVAPLLLSALIKAVEAQDGIKNAADFLKSNNLHHRPYTYPEWYAEAKSAIEAALNLKTVKPVTAVIEYCTLDQAIQLKKQGCTIKKTDYYWVDMSAWGKGYELMSAEDAEYRCRENKQIAFIDFDTTYAAFEAQDADEILNTHL